MGPTVRRESAPPDFLAPEGLHEGATSRLPEGAVRGVPDAPPLGVLTGEALGEGPWLTNVLFCAFQAAVGARGEASANAHLDDDLAPNGD